MEQLHPGAKWVFRFRGYFGALFILFFLSMFVFPAIGILTLFAFSGSVSLGVASVFFFILLGIVLIIIFGEIYASMTYTRWKFEFTPTNLKLERGIIWKRYSNIPYERVQNVDIHRGILARMLGFSSVMIQTAGFSYGGRNGMGAEGYIPAVSQERAEQIRDFLMKRISKNSKQGL